MARKGIKVNPSGLPGAVDVAVEAVDQLTFPIYKIAYSIEGIEPVDVSTTNPFPVAMYNSDGTEFGTFANPFSTRNTSNTELHTKSQLDAMIYLLEIIANVGHGETIRQFED